MDSSDYYLTEAAIQATIERSSSTEIDDPASESNAQLMDAREIAALLVVSERTVWRLQEEGQLPPPVRISKRVTRWRYNEIMQHIDELRPIGVIDRKGPRRSRPSPSTKPIRSSLPSRSETASPTCLSISYANPSYERP